MSDEPCDAPKIHKLEDPSSSELQQSMEAVGELIEQGRVRSMVSLVTYDTGNWDIFWSGLHPIAMNEKIALLARIQHELLSAKPPLQDGEEV